MRWFNVLLSKSVCEHTAPLQANANSRHSEIESTGHNFFGNPDFDNKEFAAYVSASVELVEAELRSASAVRSLILFTFTCKLSRWISCRLIARCFNVACRPRWRCLGVSTALHFAREERSLALRTALDSMAKNGVCGMDELH